MSANDRTQSPNDRDEAPYGPQVARVGPLMGGRQLMEVFLYNGERSFRRAAQSGRLPVPVFRLEGRRGWFAKTADVERWLERASQSDL